MSSDESNNTITARDRLYGKVTTYESDPHRIAEEIAELRKMLSANPNSLDLKEWLAIKLYSGDFLDEAVELFEELINKGHSLETSHFYLGNACYKRGNALKAISAWQYVAKAVPHKMRGKKAAARIKKALAELNEKKGM